MMRGFAVCPTSACGRKLLCAVHEAAFGRFRPFGVGLIHVSANVRSGVGRRHFGRCFKRPALCQEETLAGWSLYFRLVPRADMMGCQVLVSAATDFNCMLGASLIFG